MTQQVSSGKTMEKDRMGAAVGGRWLRSAPWLCAAAMAYTAQPAAAFGFDDLEKVEKVEEKERRVREAKAAAARREEEARRLAQQQAQEAEARQREASNRSFSSSGGGAPVGPGGRYSIYKDQGSAPAWAWFKQEVLVKCDGGRKHGDLPSVYLVSSGRWTTTYVGTYDTFHAAATAACS